MCCPEVVEVARADGDADGECSTTAVQAAAATPGLCGLSDGKGPVHYNALKEEHLRITSMDPDGDYGAEDESIPDLSTDSDDMRRSFVERNTIREQGVVLLPKQFSWAYIRKKYINFNI